ncbi:MAG: TonB-dependent receptor [Chitinophagaceae bacterium]|nr:MAG: TonB-dependent receptor [Chitinophagaceae bacterium]
MIHLKTYLNIEVCFFMRIHQFFLTILVLVHFNLNAQNLTDTVVFDKVLDTFSIKAEYKIKRGFIEIRDPLMSHSEFVNEVNASVPGFRLEERSPGSYRVSIRANALRSPFGVRNLRVYWNGIPITDPSGNTYFNQFAVNNFNSFSIYKSPETSIYGIGTGGAIIAKNEWADKSFIHADFAKGAFQLYQFSANGQWIGNKIKSNLTYHFSEADGYRQQSAMKRNNISWSSKIQVQPKHFLQTNLLYNHLFYETPGGLTEAEYIQNPGLARSAAGSQPSAVDANAYIHQNNLTAGITHQFLVNKLMQNEFTVFLNYSDIQNSAIRNYEQRNEPNIGVRNLYNLDFKIKKMKINWQSGFEYQKGNHHIQVFKNNKGVPLENITDDKVKLENIILFTNMKLLFSKKWNLDAGLSNTMNQVSFTRLGAVNAEKHTMKFKNEWTPQFSMSRVLQKNMMAQLSVSKGFSTPTISELLPSNYIVNKNLQAERGWNKELIVLYQKHILDHTPLMIKLTGFNYQLKNAIVQRRDQEGADYFMNAGATQQNGIEVEVSVDKRLKGLFQNLSIKTTYAFSHFKYRQFEKLGIEYSGKYIPGTPMHSMGLVGDLMFKNRFYIHSVYNGVSKIYLNDANTAVAKPYHLLGLRLGYHVPFFSNSVSVYLGINNALNETYSLGNDVNAFGGRYFNAAASRNIYGGIKLNLSNH